MDQCVHCTVRGDEKACQETTCNLHESWMVESLRSRLAQAEINEALYRDELAEVTRERDEYAERRCEVCGYAEHHREHTGCLRKQLLATQAQLVELHEENARLREDAERYREICRMFTLANEKALSILPPYRPEDYARKEQK